MLPSAHRMRRSSDFSSVVRSGTRARSARLVAHFADEVGTGSAASTPIVGFVVSKAVGDSVTRHAVTRRLRAQMVDRLATLPERSGTVIRALPAAAGASSAELGRDLDRVLNRLVAPSAAAR